MIHGPYNITTYAVAAKMFNKKKSMPLFGEM
jgi:hypothetical protein